MPILRLPRARTSSFYLFFLSFSLLLVLPLLAVGEGRDSDPPEKLSAANPEFQVNGYTPFSQFAPVVDAFDDGFVAVWTSGGSFFDDNDGASIQGRLFDSQGRPLASEFQVNSYTTGGQVRPDLAAWSDGRFVVVWRNIPEIRARLFDSAGLPVADDFVVATTAGYINSPSVEVSEDAFLVAWTGGSTADRSVMARLFAPGGTPSAAAFQLDSYTTGNQQAPDVALSPSGDFVVVWNSTGSFGDDTDYDSIQMRNLGPDGMVVGTEAQVNSWTTGDAFGASIDFADDGTFAVVWTTRSGPGTDPDFGVAMRRFDSAGSGLGNDFQVNTYEADGQYAYDVRATSDHGFVVAWTGFAAGSSDPDEYAVVAHRYDSNGASVDGDLVVNTLTAYNQYGPVLARNAQGDFLVVWESSVSAGTDTSISIQGRFLAAESDISVTVDNGVDSVVPGAQVIYTVEVSNAGPDLGTGVSLLDTLPAELTCDWSSVASGGAAGNTLSGSGDLAETLTLPAGGSVAYTLDCLVAADAIGGLLHSAEASVEQVDADDVNNTAFDLDGLVRSSDLELALSASSTSVVPGDEVEITATISQSGPSDSSGGMIFDALPPELEFVDSADCVVLAGFLECEVPPLAVGEMASVRYRVRIAAGLLPGTSIDNEAVIVADDSDPNTANDVDGLTLSLVEPLFRDGFESGTVSAWSSSVP